MLLKCHNICAITIHLGGLLLQSLLGGGFYEHMVQTVKSALRKIIGRSDLRLEELNTVLESVINCRPDVCV